MSQLQIPVNNNTQTGSARTQENRLAIVPAGSYVERVVILLAEKFGDELISFELGKAGDTDWLVANEEHGMKTDDALPAATQILNSQAAANDTPLLITISQAGNETGAATIFVHYSTSAGG